MVEVMPFFEQMDGVVGRENIKASDTQRSLRYFISVDRRFQDFFNFYFRNIVYYRGGSVMFNDSPHTERRKCIHSCCLGRSLNKGLSVFL